MQQLSLVRMPGVEPGAQAWEACLLLLHYMRFCVMRYMRFIVSTYVGPTGDPPRTTFALPPHTHAHRHTDTYTHIYTRIHSGPYPLETLAQPAEGNIPTLA